MNKTQMKALVADLLEADLTPRITQLGNNFQVRVEKSDGATLGQVNNLASTHTVTARILEVEFV